MVCPAKSALPVRCPSNLGYTDYKKTLQDIDLDIVSYPPRSFVQASYDFSTNIWGKVPKPLQGDHRLNLVAHSPQRSIEKVRTFSPVNSILCVLSYLSNAQPQDPVQRALANANATLNR